MFSNWVKARVRSWKAKAVPGSPSLSLSFSFPLSHPLECCPLAIAVNARSLSSCWRRPKSSTHKLHSNTQRIALTVNQARARQREREWESKQALHSRRIALTADYPVRARTRESGRARETRTCAVCSQRASESGTTQKGKVE